MEKHRDISSFFDGSSSVSCNSQVHPSHHFAVTSQNNGYPLVSTTLPHWVYCQQTPQQNYFESWSEPGASVVQSGEASSGYIPVKASIDNAGLKEVDCLEPSNDVVPLNNLAALEQLIPYENSNQVYSLPAPSFPPKIPKCKPKRKSDVGQSQRTKIAERLEAMCEFLPHLKELSKESAMDDIIEHIKHLKTQLKDLSQSSLGGEPCCTPLITHQGCHYLLYDGLMNRPLEEMIGKLLEVNPFAATQLLESKGLFMMPIALAEGLPPQM